MNVFATLIIAVALLLAAPAEADSYTEALAGLESHEGLFTIHHGANSDALLATLPAARNDGVIARYIHASSLRSGMGSNPVGLDRGLWDSGQIMVFRRVGSRVVIESENHRYRAVSNNRAEQQAVRESFARSVLWATPVLAVKSDGQVLIDLAGFLSGDSLGIARALERAGQGNYSLDQGRSFVDGEQLAFPDNVELEATLTFAAQTPGSEVAATTPDPRSLSLTMHHSFVRLPDDGYQIRYSDPRSAAIDIDYYDFSQPLAEPLVRRLARRFRLNKVDPASASGAVIKPIIFYVDRGAPEPIRGALLDGAGWWAEAFEAAGFRDAYEVRLLPEDAHPLDIRYNVVQWVHRQTRGWSYGGGVHDPRTGEMLKGHVILGSQRVRQDRMIFEGLAGRDRTGSGVPDDPLTLSLARIRQLAAHEVGHALGFAHNMAASSDDRSSVMDYPAPLVTAKDEALDFSTAYAVGVGAWDRFTVDWLYREFAPGVDERAALDEIVDAAYAGGLHYVADQHARPVSGAHPRGSLWDNGSDPVASLENVMAVRGIALQGFGPDRVAVGQSLSDLQTVLAPIYLYHRYQTLAAAKLIGGVEFDYSLRGAGATIQKPVAAADQQAAIDAVVETLSEDALALPATLGEWLLPPLHASEPIAGRERIGTQAAPVFDPAVASAAAARVTLTALLNRERLARLALQHADNPQMPSIASVTDALVRALYFDAEASPAQSAVQAEYLRSLMALAADQSAATTVRAASRAALLELEKLMDSRRLLPGLSGAGRSWQREQIAAFLEGRETALAPLATGVDVPPGSPIGADSCWHCDSVEVFGKSL